MKSTHLKILSLSCILVGIAILVWIYFPASPASKTTQISENYNTPLQVGEETIMVEVATTQQQKEQGLSGRDHLESGTGMVFPFDPPRQVVFWMPDMNFSIDILYIKNNQVVQIFDSIPYEFPSTPKTELPRYIAKQPIDLVLEVPAGWSSSHNVTVGTPIQLSEEAKQ